MKITDELPTWAAAYREARRAPDPLRERVLEAVRDDDFGESEPQPPPRTWRGWGVGLGVGALLGVAALLLLSLGARWVRSGREEATATPSVAPYERSTADAEGPVTERAPTPARSTSQPTAPPTTTPPSSAATASEPAPESAPLRSTARTSDAAKASATPDAAPPAPAVVSPSVDLESLRRLRAAERLLASDPARARALLDAHARDYPKSELAVERESLWIRAACRSGGASGLDARRAAFAKRTGVAAYAAAIEKDCTR